jgi:galactokinase
MDGFVVRAPGRVNLIGEHTDYNDLPVLPMALQRGTTLRVRVRDDARVVLRNADPRFAPREFELAPRIEPFEQGDWGNYAKAAAQIVASELGASRGFEALVESDVPAAAGLSSSSALVVACGLALLAANEIELDALSLAALMARGERYVGTHSGGMDQAICLAGRRGHALKIDFAPLRVEALAVPDDWRLVIAHSLVLADKSGAARAAYNQRRAECAEALQRVGSAISRADATYPSLIASHSTRELLDIASRTLDANLLARFRHEITEAARVLAARAALLARDAAAFGELMDASHASLAADYEVSHPALDQLCRLARAHGALGARLTGAGFGGCIVALCTRESAERVRAGLQRDFYANRDASAITREPVLFAEPSDGARVIR